MDALAWADIFFFEGFSSTRDGLFRHDDGGAVVSVAIGSRALGVLGVLIERRGDLLLKDEIIAVVVPKTVVEESNLTVQMSAPRRVLDHGRSDGSCIEAVARRGYRFVTAVAR